MSPKSTYNQGRESFVPDASDNPRNIWFYAAWEGVKAVCESLGIEISSIHHQVHHALCTSNGDWNLFLKDLKSQAENLTYPEKPRESFHHDYEPTFTDEDITKRAKEIFTTSFKAAFPEKRINSKFAQEKWKEVEEKAKQMASLMSEEAWNAWKKREERRQAALKERLFGWEETCNQINLIKTTIQKIVTTPPDKSGGFSDNATQRRR